MRTLIPTEVTATARPLTPVNRVLGFGLTPRTLYLLLAGIAWLIPAFFHPHRVWMMLVWDGLVVLLAAIDLAALPSPSRFAVSRRFVNSPRLGQKTRVEVELTQAGTGALEVTFTDELHASLIAMPEPHVVTAYPRDPVTVMLEFYPGRRGDMLLGNIFLRYRGGLRLVERWAQADAAQEIRVYPAVDEEGEHSPLYLMRARQIEQQKRRLRLRGVGREFESLRDYQRGDELRNISWTATARRSHLITRQFTTERSQQVWMVLDAGRLSRTAFELRRPSALVVGDTELDSAENLELTVTQLDQATAASVMLAEAVTGSGDKYGLLTYGRAVQQQLLPGTGPSHLRMLIDQLSQTRAEPSEANHLMAATRLKQMQRRRSLVIWITEIADSAGRPEVVSAAVDLVRRHLVLLVVLHHPELDALAGSPTGTIEQMYRSAAAKEMLDRRRGTIVKLRQQGVLVVEASPGEVGLRAINSYLEIKAKGLI